MTAFTLLAKLLLDKSDFDEKLNMAGELAWKVGSAIGTTLKVAGTVAAAGIGAAATGIATLTRQAVDGYANFEQLVGGVETLFGTGGMGLQEYADSVGKTVTAAKGEFERLQGAQETVLANADKAYETAGLSANAYMETVTGMSGSLIQSLEGDTVKAAEYANMAIIDMSDNANKMGSNIQSIQNAYSGFAKGNYTMLDNLKLGYGGTKTEMERLILDAEKLDSSFSAARDANGDLAMSYSDVIDAIHIVQTDMRITGTTAKEASTTIQGSLGAMTAAWQNLITGFGREDVDLGDLVDNVISTAETLLENLIPVVDRILGSIGDALTKLVPIVAQKLPEILNMLIPVFLDNLPVIIDGILQLLQAVLDQLPMLIEILVPALVQMTVQIIAMLIEHLPEILEALWNAIVSILETFGILEWVENVWHDISNFVSSIPDWIDKNVIQPILSFFTNLWDGIVKVWETVSTWFQENVIQPVVDFFSGLFDSVIQIFTDMWDGIVNIFSGAAQWFYDHVISPIANFFSDLWDSVSGFIGGLFGGGAEVNVNTNAPHLARGGVLERGQIGFLEGDGAEAVVPLDQNEKWIRAVADDMASELKGVGTGVANNVNINVYPREGQDEQSIADEVNRRLWQSLSSMEVAYG